MKIYTKTGDSGTTGLFAGPRVSKDHPRIHAYGTVDELNALLGAAVASMEALPPPSNESTPSVEDPSGEINSPSLGEVDWPQSLIRLMIEIQSDLFAIGAQLATPNPAEHGMYLLNEQRVNALENAIDAIEERLDPLSNFVLPGGTNTAAMLHVARTVCRRAEREIVTLAGSPDVTGCEPLIIYLNRLSDLLFSAARYANLRQSVAERPWKRPEV